MALSLELPWATDLGNTGVCRGKEQGGSSERGRRRGCGLTAASPSVDAAPVTLCRAPPGTSPRRRPRNPVAVLRVRRDRGPQIAISEPSDQVATHAARGGRAVGPDEGPGVKGPSARHLGEPHEEDRDPGRTGETTASSSPPRPADLSPRPTSPAASATSSTGQDSAASASTTSDTRPPPYSWNRASNSSSSRNSSATPTSAHRHGLRPRPSPLPTQRYRQPQHHTRNPGNHRDGTLRRRRTAALHRARPLTLPSATAVTPR